MPRQDGQRPQDHIVHPVRPGHLTGQFQDPGIDNGGQPFLHFLMQDQLRMVALQPQQDRGHGAVAMAGRR